MGTMAAARINTTQQMILYRDFIIEESTEGWEWTHQDFRRGFAITGTAQTIFECIEAVDDWHDCQPSTLPATIEARLEARQ